MRTNILSQQLRLTIGAALAALVLALPSPGQSVDNSIDEHGAALPEVQIQVLEQLQKDTNPYDTTIPGVALEYYNALVPEGNEATPERVELGKKLYFDKRLSLDGTVACASCHDTTRAFADARPTSEGVDRVEGDKVVKQFGTKNSPTTMNIALYHTMFWDGRSPSVEHQAMQPIINPIEMGMPLDENTIIAGIKDDPVYKEMFQKAYGREINYKDIGNALAAFERTFVFIDSPFFRYLKGDNNAISSDAKEGWILFNREGRCNSCHQISPTNPLGTDNKFHNIGVSALHQDFTALAQQALQALDADSSEAKLDELALSSGMGELGRFLVTKNSTDMGAFRTPMILNVGITGPYMHDGSFNTLWDVIDHYNKGGEPNFYLDGGIEPLNLTDRQVDQLVEFLFSLTDVRFAEANQSQYKLQKAQAAQSRPHKDDAKSSRSVLLFEKKGETK